MTRRYRPLAGRLARRALATGVLVGVAGAVCAGPASATPTPITVHRTYGPDRYATAALLETTHRDVAYIVTGEKFADGVTAGALAGQVGSNIFLTPHDQLPEEVRDVIGYYRKIVVVGSEASVGPNVMAWLQQNTRGTISRIGGADRYETSANLSAASFSPGVQNVIVATGTDYADALAGSAAAASVDSPVLLVSPDTVPAAVAAELTRLAPENITVLGGTSSIGDSVVTSLKQYTAGTVTRIGGSDRYDTAVQVSKAFFADAGWVELASGTSWADAIGAGAKAGRNDGPLLLTPQTCVPQGVNLEIERLAPQSMQAAGGDATFSVAASKRTSCGVTVGKYLEEFDAPTGNAAYANTHASLGGVFYPRSVGYTTDPRNSEYRTWDLAAKWSTFTAVAGVADGVTSGLTSHVDVYGDTKLLGSYDVAVGKPASITLDVSGVHALKLVTTSSARTAEATDQVANDVYFGDAAVS